MGISQITSSGRSSVLFGALFSIWETYIGKLYYWPDRESCIYCRIFDCSYHHVQIILQMWSCNQCLVTLAFLYERKVIINSILYRFDQKNLFFFSFFFEKCSWFKFNNLGVTLGIALKFYTWVAKWIKLKSESFGG